MTKRTMALVSLLALLSICRAMADEPSPTPLETPGGSSISPSPPPASATASPSITSAPRSARISFLPPPLEGTISLGIYDEQGRLVRVLHEEADLNEFTVGDDGLLTTWDGKNDNGDDLPSGKYRARGYLVGHLKVEQIGKTEKPPFDTNAAGTVQVRLVANPLAKDVRPTISLSVGLDDEGSFLQTPDGLPLFTLSDEPKLLHAAITKNTDRSIDVWQDNGTGVEQLKVSNVDKMMAFDCGEFELK